MATVNKDFRVKHGIIVENGEVKLDGSTSGQTTLKSSATASGTITLPAATGTVALTSDLPSTESIQDIVGAMVSDNTESGISVTYDDTNGKLDFDVTDKGSSQNIFKTVAVSGQSDIVADSNNDTLTFSGGTGITLTTNATTDTLTVTNAGVTGITGTANEIEVSASTGSVTIGLPNDVTIGNNLTVTGNLTVSGTTTTVNSETVTVADNIILLNSNVTGTPTENAGIEIERGTSNNVSLYWNETADKWYVSDGSTDTAIALVGENTFNNFANFTDGTNTASPDSTTDTFTFAAGSGISVAVNSTTDTLTITNTGILSVTGTTNQVTASTTSGAVTLSLPQDIHSSATPTFSGLNVGSVTMADALMGTAVTSLTNTSATVVDSWSATTYSSAKYIVQMKNGSDTEVIEVLVTVDGNNNVYLTEYADVQSNAQLGTTDADYSGGNVRLLVTSTNGTIVKVHKTLIEA